MKQWWVYELRAGDWLYIGQTCRLDNRLKQHRCQIRKQNKPDRWSRALKKFPHPDDWHLTVVAGPFLTKEEAMSEEKKLQQKLSGHSERLWEKLGDANSEEMKEKWRRTRRGRSLSDTTREKLRKKAQNVSVTTREKLRKKAQEQWARKRTESFFEWLTD